MRDAVRLKSYRALLAFGTLVATDKYVHAKHCKPRANTKANRCGRSSLRPRRVFLAERSNSKNRLASQEGQAALHPCYIWGKKEAADLKWDNSWVVEGMLWVHPQFQGLRELMRFALSINEHSVCFHSYADDIQLHMSAKPNDGAAINSITNCLLAINNSKTFQK